MSGEISKVFLVATSNRGEGTRRILEMAEELDVKSKQVLVKPNFNTADTTPGSTHNDTLKAILVWLKEKGAGALTLAERSGPPLTIDVLKAKGIDKLQKELGFKLINFDELAEEEYIHFDQAGFHWKDGFIIPRVVTEAEVIVNTCCLKTHGFGGVFTMSLKLAVGLIPRRGFSYMSELHSSFQMGEMIAEINAAYAPDLTVMDGVEAFTAGGPATGTVKPAKVLLASSDRVALDAAGLAVLKKLGSNNVIMNTPIFAQEQIKRAAELGLGAGAPDLIQFITEDTKSKKYADELKEILNKG
ncbi:MAG: DUF362 domain-containing protein [Peptococcaceae bacterium]